VGALKDLNIKPILLAPTGRAAKVLAQYAQEKAFTIHKRIYRQRTNADYESKYSLNFNAEKGAVFIVDEASMLSDSPGGGALFGSGSLLEDLVQYVRSGRDCRLVLTLRENKADPTVSTVSGGGLWVRDVTTTTKTISWPSDNATIEKEAVVSKS
jgi:hypothetical protein